MTAIVGVIVMIAIKIVPKNALAIAMIVLMNAAIVTRMIVTTIPRMIIGTTAVVGTDIRTMIVAIVITTFMNLIVMSLR